VGQLLKRRVAHIRLLLANVGDDEAYIADFLSLN